MDTAKRGERVEERRFRSSGETQIARLLDRVGIGYLYEHPVAVLDQGKLRIWYPDFQLPGYGIIIEYCGIEGSASYAAGMRRKKAVYEANGLTAIMLTSEDLRGHWPSKVLGRIEDILVDRLAIYRERCGRLGTAAKRRGGVA